LLRCTAEQKQELEMTTVPPSRDDWSAYWVGAEGGKAAVAGDEKAQTLSAFWIDVFEQLIPALSSVRHLDMACGAGTVTATARDVVDRLKPGDASFVCCDYSSSAVHRAVRTADDKRISGVVSNAAAQTFAPQSFDVVTSQFGLEYAGPDAFREAWRAVDSNGVLAALIHMSGGPIERECSENLRVLDRAHEQEFIPRMRKMIQTARRADTDHRVAAIVRKLETAFFEDRKVFLRDIQKTPPNPASVLIFQLLTDIGTLYQRRQNYQKSEADGWIEHQQAELGSYRSRMGSMVQASMTREQVQAIREACDGAQGGEDCIAKLHMHGDDEACAWQLRLQRR
jgi:ubiquinone/menaquinone biosynthesis C-methylase UbiE